MRVTHKPEIRFKDIDLIGHVHNSQHLVYFEQARMVWFKKVIGLWDWTTIGVIVGRNEVDYFAPIYLQDDMSTECWLESVGNKSFTLAYRIFKLSEGQEIDCANGKSVMVCMNYKTKKTQPIPEEWAAKFTHQL